MCTASRTCPSCEARFRETVGACRSLFTIPQVRASSTRRCRSSSGPNLCRALVEFLQTNGLSVLPQGDNGRYRVTDR